MDQANSQAQSYAGHIQRDVTRRNGDLTSHAWNFAGAVLTSQTDGH